MLQNVKTFCASPSTRFRQQQKLKNLFKFVPPVGSIDTRVLVLFQIYNLCCRSFGRNFSMARQRNFITSSAVLSSIMQSEFCIANSLVNFEATITRLRFYHLVIGYWGAMVLFENILIIVNSGTLPFFLFFPFYFLKSWVKTLF